MVKRRDFHKLIIGRSERINFVNEHIHGVPAKIDTGAYRSAIHASDVHEENGTVSFVLFGGHPIFDNIAKKLKTENYQKVWVSNSFGDREERFEVSLRVKIGPKVFNARFTLANRSKKVYPVLLGRTMLSGRFLIDTDESGIDRLQLRKEYGISFPNDEEEGRT